MLFTAVSILCFNSVSTTAILFRFLHLYCENIFLCLSIYAALTRLDSLNSFAGYRDYGGILQLSADSPELRK